MRRLGTRQRYSKGETPGAQGREEAGYKARIFTSG